MGISKHRTVENANRPRAVIYARTSSKRQKDEETIESQVDTLVSLAAERGYTILKDDMFLDDGFRGAILERPALDDLRDLIRVERIDLVFIYCPDRLARAYVDQLILLKEFKKYGARVQFFKSLMDNDTPEGKMLTDIQGVFAEYERKLILDRSRRGRLFKAKKGDPSILPRMPYGYERVKIGFTSEVKIVDSKATITKEIFRLFVHEGLSVSEITRRLSAMGPSPSGKSGWHEATVRAILVNPTYIGTAFYGKTVVCDSDSDQIRRCASGVFRKPKYARSKREEIDWIPIKVPAIVCMSDFELAKERLHENKHHATRNTKEPSLLQGLLICGECGLPFYKRFRVLRDRSRTNSYFCRSQANRKIKSCSNVSVRLEDLDNLVFGEVEKLVQNPSLLEQELARRAKELNNHEELQRRQIQINKELSKLSHERDRLLDAYQNGVVNLKELSIRTKEMEKRKVDLEKEYGSIQAIRFQEVTKNSLVTTFQAVMERLGGSIQTLAFKEKRDLTRLLVDKVIIYHDRVIIEHCVSPKLLAEESQLQIDGPG